MNLRQASLCAIALLAATCTRDPIEVEEIECSAFADLTFCAAQVPLTQAQLADATMVVDDACAEKLEEAEVRGPACRAAFTSAINCTADLDCAEFTSWMSRDPDSPCHHHYARVESDCGDLPLEPHLGVPETIPSDD